MIDREPTDVWLKADSGKVSAEEKGEARVVDREGFHGDPVSPLLSTSDSAKFPLFLKEIPFCRLSAV